MDVKVEQVLPGLQRRIADDALTIAALQVQCDLQDAEITRLREAMATRLREELGQVPPDGPSSQAPVVP